MTSLRPRKSAWLPLLIVGLPIAAFGAFSILDGGVLIGVAVIAFAAIVVGYNGTIRLTFDAEQITFRRFGLTVWSGPTRDMAVEIGKGGDIPIEPAYVFIRQRKRVGYVLRGWFDEAAIADLRASLANNHQRPNRGRLR